MANVDCAQSRDMSVLPTFCIAFLPTMTAILAATPHVTLPLHPPETDALTRRTMDEFFEAEVGNPHTHRAYYRAAGDFFHYVTNRHGVASLEAITPMHVSGWLDDMTARRLAVPTIKLRLAGLRMLFNALVRAQVLRINPVAVVRGPKHAVTKGKTPILDGDETAQLLTSIDTSTLIGLRDRAVIAAMAYTFARIGSVVALECRHVFRQQRRLWLRLSEKGGKSHDVPCHHRFEVDLLAWIEAAGHSADPDAPLFQSFRWEVAPSPASNSFQHDLETACETTDAGPKSHRVLSGRPLAQAMAWEMIQRRAKAAGIDTHICNHTFRATGITTYLKNGGTIERAAVIAGHASTRTTQLYDRRPDDVTLDEIEKIRFP